MFMCLRTSLIAFALVLSIGCKKEDPVPTTTVTTQNNVIKPGDIVVVNMASDSLILLDSNGNYKQVLLDLDNISESFYEVAFKKDTNEIIFTINGSPRVGAISVVTGVYRTLISDANLAGALKGLTQLPNGDILVVEAANVERFTSAGVRRTLVSSVVWPNTFGAIANPEQIFTTANGEIIICGSANVKRYTSNVVQVGSTMVFAGTPQLYGCIELADGTIALSYNGVTDQIRLANAALTSAAQLYVDPAVLGSPRTLTTTLNGNILTVDSVYNQIVEITKTGTFIRTLGGSLLGTPNAVFSVPNY